MDSIKHQLTMSTAKVQLMMMVKCCHTIIFSLYVEIRICKSQLVNGNLYDLSVIEPLVIVSNIIMSTILGNSSYPIFTKFGMQVYWVNSLYGIAFGDDSSIAN